MLPLCSRSMFRGNFRIYNRCTLSQHPERTLSTLPVQCALQNQINVHQNNLRATHKSGSPIMECVVSPLVAQKRSLQEQISELEQTHSSQKENVLSQYQALLRQVWPAACVVACFWD